MVIEVNKVPNTDNSPLAMTLSPKKYVTNFTSSTTNRGVEAKEKEMTNSGLGNYPILLLLGYFPTTA